MNFNFYHDVPGKFKKKTIIQHKAVPEKTKFSTDPFVFTSIKKLQCTLLLAVHIMSCLPPGGNLNTD